MRWGFALALRLITPAALAVATHFSRMQKNPYDGAVIHVYMLDHGVDIIQAKENLLAASQFWLGIILAVLVFGLVLHAMLYRRAQPLWLKVVDWALLTGLTFLFISLTLAFALSGPFV